MQDKLERLSKLRDVLVVHDRTLQDSARKTQDLDLPAQVPIRSLFEEICAEVPDLVPKFEIYGKIAVVRQQVTHALAKVEGQIKTLENECREYEGRNTSVGSRHHAQHLLQLRIEEGGAMLNEYGFHAEKIKQWCIRSHKTLGDVFASPWNATEFIRVTGEAQATGGHDGPLVTLREGVEFLRRLGEQLYIEDGKETALAALLGNGNKIFIGHGRSADWKDLRDFIRDKLKLSTDEFNAVPTAGYFTPERINEMLAAAAFALLVMTAEDEQPDGSKRARENVVHEIGLFQGRLGFKKAIVVLEDGCGKFSNIDGLTHLSFPKGHIRAVFQEVRETLEREGLL